MSAPRWAARRNAALAALTATALVWLLRHPTSAGLESGPSATGTSTATAKRDANGLIVADGPVIDTPYGPVQARLHLRDGTIELAAAPIYPRENLVDRAVNDEAIDTLLAQTMLEQSADVDTVSGATQTSAGYRTSLQAALDAAHAVAATPEGRDTHGGHADTG